MFDLHLSKMSNSPTTLEISRAQEYDYSSVNEEEESFLGTVESRMSDVRPSSVRGSETSWFRYVVLMITSLFIGGAIGYAIRRDSTPKSIGFADTSQLNTYDGTTFPLHEQRFNGSLFKRSAYSGPPTPDMDKTWGRFTEDGSKLMKEYPPILNISTEDALRTTSYPLETAVHLKDAQNIGYMASLGFFHQLHCLNMLRKFIHLDYYKETEPDWYSQPYLQGHADHCIDMLREALMCHGDTTLIVYHWIEGYADPVPDFSTMDTIMSAFGKSKQLAKGCQEMIRSLISKHLKVMQTGSVLVVGCSDNSTSRYTFTTLRFTGWTNRISGLKVDEKAVLVKEVPVVTVSTCSIVRDNGKIVAITAAAISTLQNQIDDAIQNTDIKAVKIGQNLLSPTQDKRLDLTSALIGALFSVEAIKIISSILQKKKHVSSVIDTEAFFKTGPAPNSAVTTALRKYILPSITILFGTVSEAIALLDEAGIAAGYPRGMGEVATLAKTLRSLGPEYVLIKREIFEESDKTTTLHFILCGEEEPLIVHSRFENPKSVIGLSYSIPSIITANLAKGESVPQAVSAAFGAVEEMLKKGFYFD
ncbi:hypothetical protein BP5796_12457 [Coleophoma crateriformis]|uniref:Pyridoxamine kinase/Phosphomethylpyrimidine kinase domain-containing protein n=1 Tax=Coleophoma crateriformis TaxID=565419 RepID=A0A3D8Q747_9HELO|nr:hypothetical protein BP5796_12457 [Coleophoma crateriformis]